MLDGLLAKRPGTKQWAQTLKSPNKDDVHTDPLITADRLTSFVDFLAGLSGFVEADNSSDLISHNTTKAGILKTTVLMGGSNKNYLISHTVPAQSTGDEWSMRFMFSASNLPAYTASGTVANTFSFKAEGAAGSGKQFAIWSGGLYYQKNSDDTYELISGTSQVGQGTWTTIEVRCDDDGGETNVYLDETLVTTTAITSADIKDVAGTGTTDMEFRWEVEGSTGDTSQYTTSLVTPMFNDSVADPFSAKTIDGISEFQYTNSGGTTKFSLLVAAGNYVYVDNGLTNAWRPLKARRDRKIHFTRYRDTVIWTDNDGSQRSSVWQWDGEKPPELLKDAPTIRFASEHQQRIIAAGDPRNPRRVYYSGSREPDVWFSPSPTNIEDEFDTLLKAGYVEVPSGEGDAVTAVWGDFHGIAIIWTKKGAWKWSGHGPTSYRIDRIVGIDVGCEGPQNVTQVGNDLWFMGRQGIQSIATTDKFGDVVTEFPSAPIQDLWTQNPTTVKRIATHFLDRASLDYNPPQGLLYVAVPLAGQTKAESIFVFNINTKVWLGPWEIKSWAMANVEIGVPRLEVMMHGADDGIVHYTDQNKMTDATGGAIAMTLSTAFLNGRSLQEGPLLFGLEKAWKKIRIYVLPRGKWNFTIDAETDSQNKMTQVTKSQNVKKAYGLTDDWEINDNPAGRLRSLEEMGIIEVRPDLRGQNLAITIKQPNAAETLVIQGIEVEFTVAGYEEE
jgi:hypothetical protein